jgi:hypothetical protein
MSAYNVISTRESIIIDHEYYHIDQSCDMEFQVIWQAAECGQWEHYHEQIGRIINALTMNETCAIADFCSQ